MTPAISRPSAKLYMLEAFYDPHSSEDIAFGGLSLSVCYRPTIGDVKRRLPVALHLAAGATVIVKQILRTVFGVLQNFSSPLMRHPDHPAWPAWGEGLPGSRRETRCRWCDFGLSKP